jgi:hypothetical protein
LFRLAPFYRDYSLATIVRKVFKNVGVIQAISHLVFTDDDDVFWIWEQLAIV